MGTFLAPAGNCHSQYLLLFLLLLSILLYLLQTKTCYFAVIVLGLFLANYRFVYYQQQFVTNNINQIVDRNVEIAGTITREPYLKNNRQYLQLSHLQIDQQIFQGKILVDTKPLPKFEYGQNVKLIGKLQAPKNFTDDFSYTGYLSKDQIFVLSHQPQIIITKPPYHNLYWYLYQFRQRMIDAIQQNLPPANAALLAGILLGEKNLLSTEQNDNFRAVGLSHIVVVSGFNLTIFAAIFLKLSRGKLPRLITFLLTAACIVFFTLLTGAESSIVRACIMSILLILAPFFGRTSQPTISILLAATIMIYLNPLILWYDAGFHLSFLATFGLIYFADFISILTKQIFFPESIKQILNETLSAQIVTIPYILKYFHNLSLIAPLSNLLVLPLVPLSMLLGAIFLILHIILPPVFTKVICLPLNLILSYFNQISLLLKKIPFSHFSNLELSPIHLIIYLIIAIILLWHLKNSGSQTKQSINF